MVRLNKSTGYGTTGSVQFPLMLDAVLKAVVYAFFYLLLEGALLWLYPVSLSAVEASSMTLKLSLGRIVFGCDLEVVLCLDEDGLMGHFSSLLIPQLLAIYCVQKYKPLFPSGGSHVGSSFFLVAYTKNALSFPVGSLSALISTDNSFLRYRKKQQVFFQTRQSARLPEYETLNTRAFRHIEAHLSAM